jgi:hypothetical protein
MALTCCDVERAEVAKYLSAYELAQEARAAEASGRTPASTGILKRARRHLVAFDFRDG